MNNLIVFTGPMKSGKSRELIKLHNKYKERYLCTSFKPIIDNRFSEDTINDRDGNKISCYKIKRLYELERFVFTTDIFFIDEFQFLSGDVEILQHLIDEGKKFIISGLNMTSERTPFGIMPFVLSIADEIHYLNGKCDKCRKAICLFLLCRNRTKR